MSSTATEQQQPDQPEDRKVEVVWDLHDCIRADGVLYGTPAHKGGPAAGARRKAECLVGEPDQSPGALRRARAVLAFLDFHGDQRPTGEPAPPVAPAADAAPAGSPPRGVGEVSRRGDGAILVGPRVFAADEATARLLVDHPIARLGAWQREDARAVLNFLDSASERREHAEQVGAFPDDAPTDRTAVPGPPRRPRVELRQQVDVDGVEVADLVVRVHPSAPDTGTAVQDAERALHDAALAVLRVLAVEPTERT